MDAFDADVLIYAAVPLHPLGRRVLALLRPDDGGADYAGAGSVLLLPEVLGKPIRTATQRRYGCSPGCSRASISAQSTARPRR